MGGHLSDLLHLLKNRQNPDSFDANSGQHFKYTTSRTELSKCTELKVLSQLNLIGAMKKIQNLIASYVWGTFNDPRLL